MQGKRRRHERAQGDRQKNPRTGRASELKDVERRKGSPDSRQRGRFAQSALGEPEDHRQQNHHAKQEDHPRSVLALAESAEEAKRVRGGSEGKERGRGPAEEQRDGMREQRAHPAEIAFYCAAAADERCVAFGGQRPTEEDREKKEDDPANLAGERGTGRR